MRPGRAIAVAMTAASSNSAYSMPRAGNRPACASRCKQGGEGFSAGPIADTNSRHGDDHFGRGFGCGFLGPATAFGAQRIGVKTKRLRNAGPEAIGLH